MILASSRVTRFVRKTFNTNLIHVFSPLRDVTSLPFCIALRAIIQMFDENVLSSPRSLPDVVSWLVRVVNRLESMTLVVDVLMIDFSDRRLRSRLGRIRARYHYHRTLHTTRFFNYTALRITC